MVLTHTPLPPPPTAHYATAQERVLFARPAVEALQEEMARLGPRRVFVVSNRSVSASPGFAEVVAALDARCAGQFTGVQAFAPRENVLAGAAAARAAGADLLLAVGGGSVIDAAKVMLLCLRHGYTETTQLDAHAEVGWNNTTYRSPDADRWLRMVAVPTTFSAAEYTARGGAMHPVTRKLEAFSEAMMIPQSVINAPEMTVATPLPLLLATGMKAVDHAVERITSRHANAFSDAVSLPGLRYLAQGLPALSDRPGDLALRANLQYGVYLSMAGRAAGVNAGLCHGIAHQLGSFAGVAHGETTCVLLPAVLRWIGNAQPGRQRMLCEAMGVDGDDAADALHAFIASLGLPTRLRDVDVRREDLPEIARRTLADPLIRNAPRDVRGAGDVLEILEAAW